MKGCGLNTKDEKDAALIHRMRRMRQGYVSKIHVKDMMKQAVNA